MGALGLFADHRGLPKTSEDERYFHLPVTHPPQCDLCKQEAVTHISVISVGGARGLNCISMVGDNCLAKYGRGAPTKLTFGAS